MKMWHCYSHFCSCHLRAPYWKSEHLTCTLVTLDKSDSSFVLQFPNPLCEGVLLAFHPPSSTSKILLVATNRTQPTLSVPKRSRLSKLCVEAKMGLASAETRRRATSAPFLLLSMCSWSQTGFFHYVRIIATGIS